METGSTLDFSLRSNRGIYLDVLEGGPLRGNNRLVKALGAAKISEELTTLIQAAADAELLLLDEALRF